MERVVAVVGSIADLQGRRFAGIQASVGSVSPPALTVSSSTQADIGYTIKRSKRNLKVLNLNENL
ncbi:Hypothetical predicted protein [Pelobates cultripes]|uniref:Uncharacterized protein n=1 Tax=Pelobates cultripes TaxID=61616 RepID=A0AAD1WVZ4_PELCU|nr:Hypothetical predicted protein [Pelobates cultripes]